MAAQIQVTIDIPDADAIDWDRRILKDQSLGPDQRRHVLRRVTTLLNRIRGGAEVATVTVQTDGQTGTFKFGTP